MDVLETIASLAANPELRLNMEKRGGACRVRYCRRDGQGRRHGIAVPKNLVAEAEKLVSESRQRNSSSLRAQRLEKEEHQRQIRELRVLLEEIGRRLLERCPRGRVVRMRVMHGFKQAVALGLDAVEAYVLLQPWKCRGGNPGRPAKL